jgi:NADPH:quinone reductase-like Zn-dependent oxidoreductase
VQLAKNLGAHVTAVCSNENRDLVTSLGADRVIDYTAQDFAAGDRTYDVIMDCVGNAPFSRVSNCLKAGGKLLLVVADLKGILLASANSRRSGKLVTAGDLKLRYTAEDLAWLVRLAEAGRYRAVIDRTYTLAEIVQAHRFVDAGRKKGNVIVRVYGE